MIGIVGDAATWTAPKDLRLYEYDGGVDKARPELVRLPPVRPKKSARSSKVAREPRRSAGGPWRRHRAERWGDPASWRHHGRLRADEPHPGARSGQRTRRRGARRRQPGRHAWPCRGRLFLRARSFQPARLHHRRQRRRKRRRPAHAGLRRHHQSRPGPGSGAARRQRRQHRRQWPRTRPATISRAC